MRCATTPSVPPDSRFTTREVEMATVTVRNGIDVGALVETIDAIKAKPELASFTFRARTSWNDGTSSTAEIGSFLHAGEEDASRERPFRLEGDEPPVLLGHNRGPNAVELLLAALGLCYSVGYVANAAARGIELEEMSYEIEGDLDVRSFLGISGEVRPGFTEIRAKARVKASGASEQELKELCTYVQETSPVKDVLASPVPVKTQIEIG
jgi:uncharacterized OsmC-like protein